MDRRVCKARGFRVSERRSRHATLFSASLRHGKRLGDAEGARLWFVMHMWACCATMRIAPRVPYVAQSFKGPSPDRRAMPEQRSGVEAHGCTLGGTCARAPSVSFGWFLGRLTGGDRRDLFPWALWWGASHVCLLVWRLLAASRVTFSGRDVGGGGVIACCFLVSLSRLVEMLSAACFALPCLARRRSSFFARRLVGRVLCWFWFWRHAFCSVSLCSVSSKVGRYHQTKATMYLFERCGGFMCLSIAGSCVLHKSTTTSLIAFVASAAGRFWV